MDRKKVIQRMKEENDAEIHKNEYYGEVYRKMISQMAKNSLD